MKTRSLPTALALVLLIAPVLATDTLPAAKIVTSDYGVPANIEIPASVLSLTDPAPFLKDWPLTALHVPALEHTFHDYRSDMIYIQNDTDQLMVIVVNGKPFTGVAGSDRAFVIAPKRRSPLGFRLFKVYGDAIVIAFVGLDKNNRPTTASARAFRFCDFVQSGNYFGVSVFVKPTFMVPIKRLRPSDVVLLTPRRGSPPLALRTPAEKEKLAAAKKKGAMVNKAKAVAAASKTSP